jgi:hypothetical protein
LSADVCAGLLSEAGAKAGSPRKGNATLNGTSNNPNSLRGLAKHKLTGDPDDGETRSAEPAIPGSILALPAGMPLTIDFHDEPELGGVEVHDEGKQRDLATKLHAQQALAPQVKPKQLFGSSWSVTHCASAGAKQACT